MERAALIRVLARRLARESDLVCAYLFGSRARGRAKATSDVDVAIVLGHEVPSTLDGLRLELAADLEEALGLGVDLVVLDGAPLDLVHRVLRDGILVIERDRGRRIAFETARRREFLDLLPVLRTYRRERGAGAE